MLTAKCAICIEGYYPNHYGFCRPPNDFEAKFCSSFFNSGDGFSCNYCKTLGFPVGFQDKSICKSKSSPDLIASKVVQSDFDNIIAFCKKMKFNPLIEKYECLECTIDRVLDDKAGRCALPLEVAEIINHKAAFVTTYYDLQPTNSLLRYINFIYSIYLISYILNFRKKQYFRKLWIDLYENSILENIGGSKTDDFIHPTTFQKIDGATQTNDKAFYDKYLKGCKVFVPTLNHSTQIFACAVCKPGHLVIYDNLEYMSLGLYKTTLYDLIDKGKHSYT